MVVFIGPWTLADDAQNRLVNCLLKRRLSENTPGVAQLLPLQCQIGNFGQETLKLVDLPSKHRISIG